MHYYLVNPYNFIHVKDHCNRYSLIWLNSTLLCRCIWEIKVNRDRDFWLHFDRIKFSSKSCDDGIVDIFLKGKLDPYLSFCGDNVSLAKDLPILSSADLSLDGSDPSITIQFIGKFYGVENLRFFSCAWFDRHI